MSDRLPGIRRRRAGRGFVYVGSRGKRIRRASEIARIRSIVIPPAWADVWICPSADGHIQAVGRDARGRKQYRYHVAWRSFRDRTKFDRMVAFARRLPAIRRRVRRDLARAGLPREKILAAIVQLLEGTQIRIGNREYARDNGSFGMTTLRNRHVRIEGERLRFRFSGKGGKPSDVELRDRRLATIVRRCQELPGQELFQYLDDQDEPRSIGSSDVNDYLREVSGDEFTAKDFRTWSGTVLAATALGRIGPARGPTEAARKLARAIEEVAGQLGNTPSVCRKHYVHPLLFESYLAAAANRRRSGARHSPRPSRHRGRRRAPGLDAAETAVVALLEAGATNP